MYKNMNYHEAVEFVKNKGWDEFLNSLKKEFPQFKLYGCSTAWFEDRQYICKARGVYGDLIIRWM